jgi:hypothetical protein
MLSRNCIGLWGLFWLVAGVGGVWGADTMAIETFARALASADRQRQALEELRERPDPTFRDLLVALKDGALYH